MFTASMSSSWQSPCRAPGAAADLLKWAHVHRRAEHRARVARAAGRDQGRAHRPGLGTTGTALAAVSGPDRRPGPARRRSRGVLPLLAAAGESLDRGTLADLDPFRLVVAEPGRAVIQSWDGRDLVEQDLPSGLHLVVNSGLASDLAGRRQIGAEQQRASQSGADQAGAERLAVRPPDGREHEMARIAHFLGRFASAARPDPRPGQAVSDAWGAWFPLVNGDGIGPADQRALIVQRDLGGGRTWGTTSVSLVALAPGRLRYDFTGRPGDVTAWYSVLPTRPPHTTTDVPG